MENAVVHIGENSPEYVAFRLMDRVFMAEDSKPRHVTKGHILDTYSECLQAVKGYRLPQE